MDKNEIRDLILESAGVRPETIHDLKDAVLRRNPSINGMEVMKEIDCLKQDGFLMDKDHRYITLTNLGREALDEGGYLSRLDRLRKETEERLAFQMESESESRLNNRLIIFISIASLFLSIYATFFSDSDKRIYRLEKKVEQIQDQLNSK